MRANQIAAQLYTVREFCKDSASLTATAKKIRQIGYTAVQVSGVGPIDPAEIRRICTGEGLTICATHESGKMICEEPEKVVDRLGALGCTATAYPFPHVPLTTLAEVESLAAQLDRAGAVLRSAGMVLCYHNHDHEFVKIAGRTILDWLYALTRPAMLQGEPDVFWVQAGGGDPVTWCRKLAGRLPLVHLKDLGPTWGADGKLQSRQMMEVGHGSLDMKAICAAAESSGCQWFIVEQDVCPGDPFVSLDKSWRWLMANVVA